MRSVKEKLYHQDRHLLLSAIEILKHRGLRRQRNENKRIARERIHILFSLAETMYSQEPELAQRYVTLARKIGMRYKVKIPREHRWKICHSCKSYLHPGQTCRVRFQSRRESHLVITCFTCGESNRMPLHRKEI
jgi:ribonuclease P protein subunit RPR2